MKQLLALGCIVLLAALPWEPAALAQATGTATEEQSAWDRQQRMPSIAASGDQLLRGDEVFRVFGLQNLEHAAERAFYVQGTSAQREAMAARLRLLRNIGANTLRIHLQLFDFVAGQGVDTLYRQSRAFANLQYLLHVAEREGIYLLVSGNNAWFPDDIPNWYDALPYRERWEVQAFFFEQLAIVCAASPAVLGYELVSEPVIRRAPDSTWYAGELEGYYFVQTIARGVSRAEAAGVARDWITRLTAAIRSHDQKHLVTFGAMGRFHGGALGVRNTAPLLDFLSPHIYPDAGDPGFAANVVARYTAAGKPVVVGETHLYRSGERLYRDFLAATAGQVSGYISFFYARGEGALAGPAWTPVPAALHMHRLNLEVLRDMREEIIGTATPAGH